VGGGNNPFGTSNYVGVRSSSIGRSTGKFMYGSMVAGIAWT
jgi:hypothetical protein